ncbi:hypothetical protein RRG08_032256 [Elysia crispata]|uniref:Uncharacterized protein n=1 Tax=Elysia crispata TaxID=231223 RepID=A0AAE1B0A6_9GAST|nr:hypothetical protein RRG08_032256 [Elysia crispata]
MEEEVYVSSHNLGEASVLARQSYQNGAMETFLQGCPMHNQLTRGEYPKPVNQKLRGSFEHSSSSALSYRLKR